MYLRTFEICIEIYELDPACFLIISGLALQAALKKMKVKLDLLTDSGMLLMAEKEIKGRICPVIQWHVKANNKYMNDYDKN